MYKNKLETSSLAPKKESILTLVKRKIKKLRHKIQSKPTKLILWYPNVQSYLETIENCFIAVNINKAANNFLLSAKKYYICKPLAEAGLPTQNLKHIRNLRIS